jgi:HD-like signal output (HDOD) protein
MSTLDHSQVAEQILHAIDHNDMVLPTLPDIAIKLQKMIDDPNVSAEQIVTLLTTDPAISAQIIKSANSAAFADKPAADNVRGAISRLGYRQLSNLVISITMNKMFFSHNPVFHQKMLQIWERSREVAAVSYVLALRQHNLSPDHALLAGLVHDIGVLPLFLYIEKNNISISDQDLTHLIEKCSDKIGTRLLKKWNFSPDIIDVVAEHENFHRLSSFMPLPDYADVVMFANLQTPTRAKLVAWNNIAAATRLGLSEDECRNFLEDNEERINRIKGLLGITQTAKPSLTAAVHNVPITKPVQAEEPLKKRGWFASIFKL